MKPPLRLALLLTFLALPLLEIAILIKVGQELGFWPTFGIVVATAVIGAQVLHSQGLATLERATKALAAGQPPMQPVAEGVLLLLAGALLVTPGVLTDMAGLSLLVPSVRQWAARQIIGKILSSADIDVAIFTSGEEGREPPSGEPRRGGPERSSSGGGVVIEGEFERLEERTIPPADDPAVRKPRR